MRVGYRTVTVVTSDGERIQGLKKAEDTFSIQIVDTSERLQGYLKADLQTVQDEAESLMPPFAISPCRKTSLHRLATPRPLAGAASPSGRKQPLLRPHPPTPTAPEAF